MAVQFAFVEPFDAGLADALCAAVFDPFELGRSLLVDFARRSRWNGQNAPPAGNGERTAPRPLIRRSTETVVSNSMFFTVLPRMTFDPSISGYQEDVAAIPLLDQCEH